MKKLLTALLCLALFVLAFSVALTEKVEGIEIEHNDEMEENVTTDEDIIIEGDYSITEEQIFNEDSLNLSIEEQVN